MKTHNRYNPKPFAKGIDFTGHDEVANQQMASECEIRTILERYVDGTSDELPVVREAVYNDQFITPQTYNDAKSLIDKVKHDFCSLPVETQRKFGDFDTYVKDVYAMSQGNSEVIAKYSNLNVPVSTSNNDVVSSVKTDTDLSGASGNSSSSLSRGDTNSDNTALK